VLAEAETAESVPWLVLAVAAAALPVSAFVVWRVARWWVASGRLPLPFDRALPAVPWDAWYGLLVFAVAYVMMPLVVAAYEASVSEGLVDPPAAVRALPASLSPGAFLGQVLPALAMLAALLPFGRRALGVAGCRSGSAKRDASVGGLAFAAALPVCLVLLFLSTVLFHVFVDRPIPKHPLLEDIAAPDREWYIVPLAFVQAAVLAPLVEELAYRGVLQTTLLRAVGPGPALVASGAVFGMAHFPAQPQAVPSLFVLGLVLGYVFYRTRSLVAPIVAHALFNGVMLLGKYCG
jgi:membrane protease YdiL (CAAX protease family)